MASRNAERREPVTRGTGNVFADLGFPDAAERQAKLRLAYALNQVLEARKLSQADAAKVLGLTQPKVSALRNYKLAGFSVERLMNLLTAVDQDIEIVIHGSLARGRWAASAWWRPKFRLDRRTSSVERTRERLIEVTLFWVLSPGFDRPEKTVAGGHGGPTNYSTRISDLAVVISPIRLVVTP